MPGVLIETGFISNPADRNFMISEEGNTKLATSIFNAFQAYKKKIEYNSNFNLVAANPILTTESKTKQLHDLNDESRIVSKQSDIFFSIQLITLNKKLETNTENFQGETDVFYVNSDPGYCYLSGKFKDFSKAEQEKNRLKAKFKDAIVVAIENGKLISVKKALRRM
jgi:N-acetylmuramoyl-L-alanine amidase